MATFPHAAVKRLPQDVRDLIARQYVSGGGSMEAATLLAGNFNLSIDLLTAACNNGGKSSAWNDLAVARFERARELNDPRELLHALSATNAALALDPQMREAAFNRALILDALGLRLPARRAFVSYLQLADSEAWADEALWRLNNTGITTAAVGWRSARPKLERACLEGRQSTVATIAGAFAQQARTWSEGEYLSRWATEFAAQAAESGRWLAIARCVGEALQSATGDRLLLDTARLLENGVATRRDDAASLAAAHIEYRAARLAYRDRDLTVASTHLHEALETFERARSPFALVCTFYLACAAYDRGDVPRALDLLEAVAGRTPAEYKSLRAQIEYERSLALGAAGDVHESLAATMKAAQAFDALHENDNAARAAVSQATLMVALGRPQDAWRIRVPLFRRISATGDATLLQTALGAAAADEVFIGHWSEAAALYREFTQIPGLSPQWRADAFLWTAMAAARGDGHGSPSTYLERARASAREIGDPDLREAALDDIRFGSALLMLAADPRRAAENLSATIAFRERKATRGRLPAPLVARARALHATGDDGASINDLEHAIAILEAEPPSPQYDVRERFFGAGADAFDLRIELAAMRGDTAGAFDTAERARRRASRSIDDVGARHDSSLECARLLPHDTVLVQMTALERMLIAIVVRDGGHQLLRIPLARQELDTIATNLATAADNHDTKSFNRELSRVSTALTPLIAKIEDAGTLIFEADDTTARLPFTALIDGGRRPLIERHIVELTSAALCRRRAAWSLRRTATVIGDPALDPTEYGDLEPLPEARTEAEKIADMYSAKPLTGAAATKDVFLRDAAKSDVIHVAAHTVSSAIDPFSSAIPLSAAPHDRGALYLHDVAALELRRAPVVVLAGCRTAAGTKAGRPIHTFALAFEAAGASAVIGTLWNVDDGISRRVSLAIHRGLRAGESPAAAIRQAQLSILHSPIASDHDPMTWSAFQVYATR